MNKVIRFFIIRFLARRLGVTVKTGTLLANLTLNEYTQNVVESLGFKTVGDMIEAYCLRLETPGMGDRSWEDFFQAVRR